MVDELQPADGARAELPDAKIGLSSDLEPKKRTSGNLEAKRANGLVPLESNSSVNADLLLAKAEPSADLQTKARVEPNPLIDTSTLARRVPPHKDISPRPVRAQPRPVQIARNISTTTTATSIAMKPVRRERERHFPATSVTPKLNAKEQQRVLWDQWYDRVGKLCDSQLAAELEKHGNPAGSCTVEVSVRKDCHIGVISTQRDGEAFSTATLAAYRSLDGHPAWQFPAGSRRSQVRFVVKNSQDDAGPVIEIEGKRITGDSEN
jgi:hypothetical protein